MPKPRGNASGLRWRGKPALDALYAISDPILVGLIAELSSDDGRRSASAIPALLLPQIFEARGARLARLTLANSGLSGVQWFALLILALSSLVVLALVHNNEPGHQALAMSLYAVATAATFFVILAHDRPFVGVISVSPKPLLQVAAKANAARCQIAARDFDLTRGTSTYCCGMPAASRTAFQRANSRAMCSPNASGLEPRTTTPAVVKRFCTTSSARLSLMTLLSLMMISCGTPRGANTPYHVVTSQPGSPPVSTAAGPFGTAGKRSLPVTASALG